MEKTKLEQTLGARRPKQPPALLGSMRPRRRRSGECPYSSTHKIYQGTGTAGEGSEEAEQEQCGFTTAGGSELGGGQHTVQDDADAAVQGQISYTQIATGPQASVLHYQANRGAAATVVKAVAAVGAMLAGDQGA